MHFDVVTPPVIDVEAEPSTSRLPRVLCPVGPDDGEVVQAHLGVGNRLVQPGFTESDDTDVPEGPFETASRMLEIHLVTEGLYFGHDDGGEGRFVGMSSYPASDTSPLSSFPQLTVGFVLLHSEAQSSRSSSRP